MVCGLCPYVTCRNVKYTNHRRGRRPRRPLRRMTDDAGSSLTLFNYAVGEGFHALPASVYGRPRTPVKMVRGLCPRNFIRWAVDGGGRAIGNVGAIGQAGRMRLTRPGNHANAGRRGRRPLRAGARRRYPHHSKQMRKGNRLRPPLGSPGRGAVAARSAVTEWLVRRG